MSLRYFRAPLAVYADICAQLDAAYGYPNEATKTLRTLPLPMQETTDAQGRVYLAISSDYCDYDLPSELLPGLIASGAVQEITVAQYRQQVPELTP